MGQTQSAPQLRHEIYASIYGNNLNELRNLFKLNQSKLIERSLNHCDGDVAIPPQPIFLALKLNDIESLKFLLDNASDISVRDTFEQNVLHYSSLYDNERLVRFVIEEIRERKGEDQLKILINQFDCQNRTPLRISVSNNNTRITELLLENDAIVNRRTTDGISNLSVAVDNGNVNMVNILLQYNAVVNIRDSWGWSPLHIAAAHNDVTLCKMLLNRSCPINAEDQCGCTPLTWARIFEAKHTYQLLKQRGAKEFVSNRTRTARFVEQLTKDDNHTMELLETKQSDLLRRIRCDNFNIHQTNSLMSISCKK
ncbi:hypothetical protein SNEBB_001499 [Seison nebaliae]|nr:hypothetical protein SNEBB_001499 [Seison nebaliae]